ncbi:hypothetical protein LXL04_004125 [Taraxacum kok-saghyz]
MKSFCFLLCLVLVGATSLEINAQTCKPSGGIHGRTPPPGKCNQQNNSDCCVKGDGGGPSECDNQYHDDDTPVVALSTGWYKGGDRCHKYITINGNGRSVKAMVVDECDSTMGCDGDHDYQPPCPNNIVDASKAVWKALGVSEDNWGDLGITWTDFLACKILASFDYLHAYQLHWRSIQTCKPSGGMRGRKPPPGECNQDHDSDCCVQGKFYTTYTCSPPVTGHTKARLTINSFQKGGDGGRGESRNGNYMDPPSPYIASPLDGGGPSECDNRYHDDNTPVVALSTGWYKGGDRCHKYITINGNGRSVRAMVVDECDSTMGCDGEHDYQPPCPNNIVDASEAVWKALGVSEDNWGDLDITWTE